MYDNCAQIGEEWDVHVFQLIKREMTLYRISMDVDITRKRFQCMNMRA